MSRHGGALWAMHPHVRSGKDLTFGERAADRLKTAFGSWAFLIGLNAAIVVYCLLEVSGIAHFDPYPFIALNLILSWLAAQQGGALQIAANRGDRISAEVATGTNANTAKLLDMQGQLLNLQQRQMEILRALHSLGSVVAGGPAKGGAGSNPAESGFGAEPEDGPVVPPPATTGGA